MKGDQPVRTFLKYLSRHPKTAMFVFGMIVALPLVFDRLFFVGWVSFLLPAYIEYTVPDSVNLKRHAYLRGFSFFMGFGIVLFSWFTELYPLDFTGLSRGGAAAVVAAGWFGLSALQASVKSFMFVILGIVSRRTGIRRSPAAFSGAFACLFVMFEWIEHQTWAGVPWGNLAIGQASFLPMIQITSVFGSYAVTFILVFAGSLIGTGIAKLFASSPADVRPRTLRPFIAALLLLSANIGFGCIRLATYSVPEGSRAVTAAAIQGNISSYEKWAEDSSERAYNVYESLTEEAAEAGAELVVWPETPIVYNLSGDFGYEARSYYRAVSRENNVTLIAGAFTESADGVEENSVVSVTPDRGIDDTYYVKRRLVPFGEFVPLRSLVSAIYPPLSELSVLADDLAAGTEPTVLETPLGAVSPIICFDSIYPELTRDSVRCGGELITLSTNDSWFGNSAAGGEHNRHAVLRAVESGKYLIRAASTGISSIISPTGSVDQSLGQSEYGFILSDVYMIDENTVYTTIGDISVIASAAAFAVIVLLFSLDRKRLSDRGGDAH